MTGAIWQKPLISKAAIFSFVLFAFFLSGGIREMSAQAFSEGFDTVVDNDPMPLPNWVAINRSAPLGSTMWYQGDPDAFPSYQGPPNSYIAADYHATTGDNTISLWLLTPQKTFNNGDVIKFYTQTVAGSIYPDRLQLRLSTAGASTDVGTTPTSVGVFTNLLLDINPTLQQGGYPEYWTYESARITGLSGPTSGRIAFRYFVTNGGPSGANSYYIGIDSFSLSHPAAHQESDYDGDGVTDFSVVRNTGGQLTWFNNLSSSTFGEFYQAPWGIATDFVAPGDYDGDNKTDVAVWRSSTTTGQSAYYIFYTGTSTLSIFQFGQNLDNPDVHADYDGDGKTDIAVYRGGAAAGQQSYWFYRGSLNNPAGNITYIPWGVNGDFPAPGDYDGDGRADFTVQRNAGGGFARFWTLSATGAVSTVIWGTPTDFIVPGDYDGDGKTDIATIRGSGGNRLWYIRSSSAPTTYNYYAPTAIFGSSATDFICQGDYDGDGKTDIAVWRPNVDPTMNYFYWIGSTSGFGAYPWGLNGDYPAANWNTH